MNILIKSCFTVGILCLLYYVICIIYAGIASSFGWFWLLCGFAGIAGGFLFRYIQIQEIVIPRTLRLLAGGLFIIAVVIFLIVEAFIISYGNRQPKPGADYVIVLGAQVRGTTITKSLKRRLDKAMQYLNDNPQTKVVVSGGQGTGELITEAAAMEEYLVSKGIEAHRIIKEDASTNTNENLLYSAAFTGHDKHVVIVSNSFHLYRALSIAKKQGYQNAEGLAAHSDKILMLSYYVREGLAVIKDILVGNM